MFHHHRWLPKPDIEPASTNCLPAILGQAGNLDVRLAHTRRDIHTAQKIRYQVFFREMGAKAALPQRLLQRDWDHYDDYCDHVLVFDRTRKPAFSAPLVSRFMNRAVSWGKAIGTYRLLSQDKARLAGGFYSQQEYDLTALLEKNPGRRFLELGRSCVLPAYRNRRTLELLWYGIWRFARAHKIDVMIGCASFPSPNPKDHTLGLSFLHHFARAEEPWAARAHPHVYTPMALIPAAEIDPRRAIRALPPLIKGYLRLGAMFGDGAVIDPQFGTTDVLVILPISRIADRYFDHFGGRPDP